MTLRPEQCGLSPIEAWNPDPARTNARKKLEWIRAVAPDYKRDFLREQPVVAVRTIPTSRAPYPLTYGFNRACSMPYPYLMMFNRCLLVQFLQKGRRKTLLMNPTIPDRASTTPFFVRLTGRFPFGDAMRKHWFQEAPVEEQLESLGMSCDDIDYVAFDHQHVQDLRPYLGTSTEPKRYRNAKYLVQRSDWEASVDLHPLQASWFVPHTAEDVDSSDLVLLDGDVSLGEGCALLSTPGHTWGNQSLLFRTAQRGCFTVSENGVCMDAYSPEASRIPGLRAHARTTGEEVILNANTLENTLDQYNSMVKEKLLADPYPADPRFVQHFASSELTHAPFAPGLRPTHSIREVSEGELLSNRNPAIGHSAVSRGGVLAASQP